MTRLIHHLLLILTLSLISVSIGYAQPSNSDCTSPVSIPSPSDYCSGQGEYTNVLAGQSGYGAAQCWDGSDNDVWFQFTAIAKTVSITVIGNGSGGGSMNNPQVALYEDNGCTGTINELRCGSDVAGNGIVSFVRGALVVGQSYYIRVDARSGNQGTFQLCVSNFNPPVDPGQDCATASILCDKSPFIVESVSGAGLDTDEASGTCLGTFGFSESSSTWFKWTCKTAGTLTFVLDPIRKTDTGSNPGDDLDFALFELLEGIDNCGIKSVLRCNATHPFNYSITGNASVGCNYETGLDFNSNETTEDSGCDAGEDGFVRFIDMEVGKSYALLVNNFSDSGQGFEVSFGGTGEFLGPEPDFDVDPLDGLRCDTFFTVTDLSTFDSANGNIVEWEWSFGAGSDPAFATGPGPHQIIYNTFGQKSITLTVTSDKGCVVTKILPLNAEACCEDIVSDLGVDATVEDIKCAGDEDGSIMAQGTLGFPPYTYSIDGSNFTTISTANNLGMGTYDVVVQDSKGCIDFTTVAIEAPDPLIVEAGPDVTVDLGTSTQLDASYTPVNGTETIEWIVNQGLDCTDCLDPTALAPGTTTYVLQVIDANGCIVSDSVTVRTLIDIDRPIFSPNIIWSGINGDNGRFMVGTGPAADLIEEIQIYDRWGNLIWKGLDLQPNDFSQGWDGKFNGEFVNPAVFAWVARVHYLDDVVINYGGDFTVVR